MTERVARYCKPHDSNRASIKHRNTSLEESYA